jgi:biopolymer transport protein ExbD
MASAASPYDEDGITSINITPLVDVFLVLLILVMISSSLLDQKKIPVSLPKAANAGGYAPKASGLTLDADRKVYLNGVASDSAGITEALKALVSRDSTHQVLIAADLQLRYQDVVRVLDWVEGSGVRKYALKVAKPG